MQVLFHMCSKDERYRLAIGVLAVRAKSDQRTAAARFSAAAGACEVPHSAVAEWGARVSSPLMSVVWYGKVCRLAKLGGAVAKRVPPKR